MEATGHAYVAALAATLLDKGLIESWTSKTDPEAYAIFDILSEEDDLLADYAINTHAQFEQLRQDLGLRVSSSTCDECDPMTFHRQAAASCHPRAARLRDVPPWAAEPAEGSEQ